MKAFLLGLVVLFSLSANAQIYLRNYEIESDDKVVGGITATRSSEGDFTEYIVTSEVTMRIIFEINVSYKVQAVYKNEVLVSSSATIYLNGAIQNDVSCERTGDHYTVVVDGHTTRIYEDIQWSSAKLYFNKPKGAKKVFSETDGNFKNMGETSDGKFVQRDPQKDKNVNTYTYSSDQGLHSILFKRMLLPDLTVTSVREVKIDAEKEE